MVSLPDLLLPKIKYWGISIERSVLRGVELEEGAKGARTAEVDLPETTFSQGVLTSTQTFIERIAELAAKGKFSSPYVAVSFPEAFAFSREFSLPILPPEEMHEAVSWHVKELFPFPQDEIYFDWRVLEKKEKEYQIVVVAIQKTILDELVNALISAGLKPLRFEPDASAIARLLVLKNGHHALVTELGRKGAYVTLVEGEKALFTTVVNYTSEDSPESYVKSIDQTLTEIASYYQKKGILKEGTTQIVLTGELISDHWIQHLSDLLKFPVAVLKTDMLPAFHKAFVCASTPIAPPRDEQSINLLPVAIQSYYDADRTTLLYKTLLTRLIVSFGMTTILAFIVLFSLMGQRQSADVKVKELTNYISSQRSDTQNLLLLNAKAKNIVSLAPQRVTPQDELEEIVSLLSKEIIISQWEYDDSKLQYKFVGLAITRDDLLAFKQKLEGSENFARVSLPLGSLETKNNVRFTITFISKQ